MDLKDRKTKLALTAVMLTGVIALATIGTFALFTNQQTAGANAFSTGSIDLSTAPANTVITVSGMVPGDTRTDPIVASNDGTSSLRYSVSSSATNADGKGLKDQLVLTVKTVDVTDPVTPCDAFDGTQLYTGDLDSTAGLIIGDPATGQNGLAASGGDRLLAASASETLCFRVHLPVETGNAFQGATTTATFTFDAEQTTNT